MFVIKDPISSEEYKPQSISQSITFCTKGPFIVRDVKIGRQTRFRKLIDKFKICALNDQPIILTLTESTCLCQIKCMDNLRIQTYEQDEAITCDLLLEEIDNFKFTMLVKQKKEENKLTK